MVEQCAKGTCEHNAYSRHLATLRRQITDLQKDNKSLGFKVAGQQVEIFNLYYANAKRQGAEHEAASLYASERIGK